MEKKKRKEKAPVTMKLVSTHKNFPSSQSDAILRRRGGLLGLPSVRKSWLPVSPTKIGAIGGASFSKMGIPKRNGSWEENIK